MKKLNMTIGKFQPITKGHINMIEEGENLCIVYRINADDKVPETLKGWKVKGKVVRKEAINNVVSFLDNNGQGDLTEQEKELVKRPFTNDLIDKELEIVKKNTKNILEVVPVKNMYDALDRFNAFCTEHKDEYEPCYWMCGDDRVDNYSKTIGQYDELETELGSGKKLPNILKDKLQTNTGKGRTEGVSGTAVRKSIINKDKATFEKIMPKGVGSMFDDFVKAFEDFKDKLQNIKEGKMLSLKDYIIESKSNKIGFKQYFFESEQMNQSDEDFFITMLGWIVSDGGGMKIEDDVIKIEIKKDHKKETLDLCKKEGFEVIKAESCGKGYTSIEIKRDKSKQVKKYNLN